MIGKQPSGKWLGKSIRYTNNLTYQGLQLSFVEYLEYHTDNKDEHLCRHVHLTDMEITGYNAFEDQ